MADHEHIHTHWNQPAHSHQHVSGWHGHPEVVTTPAERATEERLERLLNSPGVLALARVVLGP